MDLFIYKVNHWICSHQWYQEEAGNEEKEQQWSGRRGTHKSWQKEDQVGNLRAFGYRPVFSRGWRAGVTSAQKSKLNSTCSCLLLETSSHDYVGKKLKKQLALGHLGNMSPMPKGPILSDRSYHTSKPLSQAMLAPSQSKLRVMVDYKISCSHFSTCALLDFIRGFLHLITGNASFVLLASSRDLVSLLEIPVLLTIQKFLCNIKQNCSEEKKKKNQLNVHYVR